MESSMNSQSCLSNAIHVPAIPHIQVHVNTDVHTHTHSHIYTQEFWVRRKLVEQVLL